MNTYQQKVNGVIYRYWYDRVLRSWVVQTVDKQGNQTCDECDYYGHKSQLIECMPEFNFKH